MTPMLQQHGPRVVVKAKLYTGVSGQENDTMTLKEMDPIGESVARLRRHGNVTG